MGIPDYHYLRGYSDYSSTLGLWFRIHEKKYWLGSYRSNSDGRLSGPRVAAKGIRRVTVPLRVKVPHRRSQRSFRLCY
jgi:hypothetical protein